MITKISVPVSVHLSFNHRTNEVAPRKIYWDGKDYFIQKIGLHHTYRNGNILYHVFSVASETLFFRLVLNTGTLHWRLEEIADGLSG